MSESARDEDRVEAARVFTEHRQALVGVAYQLLGSVADAEDVVQEAWLRWVGRRPSEVVAPRAYLVRVTTRLALDRMRRVKARRESYVGPWLPEPLLTSPDVAEDVELAESVSMALLIVLETLSPLERAVFVLREAFAFPYGGIADVLAHTEVSVRQVARRARNHVDARQPRFDTDQTTRRQVTERFLAACQTADLDALMELLAPGVTLISDGGGQARAPRRPIHGADKVARFLRGVSTYPVPDIRYRLVQLNGGPGIVITSEGVPVSALILGLADGGLVRTIHLVANPDKLTGVHVPGMP